MSNEIDLIPYMSYAIGKNANLYTIIDNIYREKATYYKQLADESKYNSYRLINEGTIQTDEYSKKALGIILSAIQGNQDDIENINKIIMNGWKYVYTYVVNKNTIDVDDFMQKFIKKYKGLSNITDTELLDSVLVLLFYILNLNKDIKEESGAYKVALEYFSNYIEVIEKYNINAIFKAIKQDKEASKNFNKLKKAALKYIGIDSVSFIKISTSPKLKYLYETLSMVLELEGYDVEIMNLVKFKDKDFEEVLLLYYIISTNNTNDDKEILIKNIKLTDDMIKNIDFTNFPMFLCSMMIVKIVLKLYTEAKEYYFRKSSDSLLLEKEIMKKEIDVLNNEINIYKQKIALLENEIKEKELEIKRLNNENKEKEYNKNELIALREMLFELESKDEKDEEETIDYKRNNKKLDNEKILIIGGINKWGQQIISELADKYNCDAIHISNDNINFDAKLLTSYRHIFIIVKSISHAMYYKIINSIGEENKIYFVPYINKEKTIDYIIEKAGI